MCRCLVAGMLAGIACATALPAGAIVSERHLRGVHAMACDLEAGGGSPGMTFNLKVFAKERMLQLAGTEYRFGYEEISDSALRFRLALGHGPALDCDLELPAGALACAAPGDAGGFRLGLCLPSQ